MNKFAFYNDREKSAMIEAVRHAPEKFAHALMHFAQGVGVAPQQAAPAINQQSPAVEERLQVLRDYLHDFVVENNLGNEPGALKFIEQVVQKMRPALQESLKGVQSLDSQLQGVPQLDKTQQIPQEIAQPSDLNELTPNGKPTTVPKGQKLSPQKQSPLWRKPPLGASKDESFDNIVLSMLEVADLADESGMFQHSDKLASILPAIRTVKIAQYEGFQNYWIANGRAFEMAYKEKRKKGKTDPADFRSAHEVWFEILEEYQKSLLTNQADFIAKYAGKNFSHSDKAASEILMTRISARMQKGSSPGVALYEAIDELAKGKHFQIVASTFFETIKQIESEAALAGNIKLSNKAMTLQKEAANWFGKLLRFLGFNYGNPTTSIPKVLTEQVKRKLITSIRGLYHRATAGPTPVSALYKEIGPYYDLISEFIDRAKYVKRRGLPALNDPQSVADADGNIDPNKLAQFATSVESALAMITPEVAARIDKDIYANSEGLSGSAASNIPDAPAGPVDPAAAAAPGAPASPAAPGAPAASPAVSPTAAPAAPAVPISGDVVAKDFGSLKPEEQFDFLSKFVPEIKKWYANPEAVKVMTARGTFPDGRPYTAPHQVAAPKPPVPPAAAPAVVPTP